MARAMSIGIISEGDLMPRDEAAREARRDWWLQMLSEGEEMHADFISFLKADKRTAREIMVSPVVTINDDAELLSTSPNCWWPTGSNACRCCGDGKLVGIVSRADLFNRW